jgi:hypothetical protein
MQYRPGAQLMQSRWPNNCQTQEITFTSICLFSPLPACTQCQFIWQRNEDAVYILTNFTVLRGTQQVIEIHVNSARWISGRNIHGFYFGRISRNTTPTVLPPSTGTGWHCRNSSKKRAVATARAYSPQGLALRSRSAA